MANNNNIIVGIDASRNRSGGSIEHMIGILSNVNIHEHGIYKVHIWSYENLLNMLPNRKWLVKHHVTELEGSLIRQIYWQLMFLSKELKRCNCDILFSSDASTFCRFRPMVVLSQDLLSYEPRILKQYRFSIELFRIFAIMIVQNLAFRFSNGVIFLTKYSSDVIQKSCGKLSNFIIIPHGSDNEYSKIILKSNFSLSEINVLYVSSVEIYKYQWNVVKSIAELRSKGYNVSLTLIGDGCGRAKKLLKESINKYDKEGEFVFFLGHVEKDRIFYEFEKTDIFVFASGCEAFGISLLEAMSAGLSIASSNKSCVPELLEDGGLYFNPEDPSSIVDSIEALINDNLLRDSLAEQSKNLSRKYSWEKCAFETWSYISNVCKGGK